MDLKKKLANATMDKRQLQMRSIELKKSMDEVLKVLGSGKPKKRKK